MARVLISLGEEEVKDYFAQLKKIRGMDLILKALELDIGGAG